MPSLSTNQRSVILPFIDKAVKSQGHKAKRLVDNTLSKASWQNCEKVFAIEVLTSVDMHDCLLTDLHKKKILLFV